LDFCRKRPWMQWGDSLLETPGPEATGPKSKDFLKGESSGRVLPFPGPGFLYSVNKDDWAYLVRVLRI
jgi:hypothetical protein